MPRPPVDTSGYDWPTIKPKAPVSNISGRLDPITRSLLDDEKARSGIDSMSAFVRILLYRRIREFMNVPEGEPKPGLLNVRRRVGGAIHLGVSPELAYAIERISNMFKVREVVLVADWVEEGLQELAERPISAEEFEDVPSQPELNAWLEFARVENVKKNIFPINGGLYVGTLQPERVMTDLGAGAEAPFGDAEPLQEKPDFDFRFFADLAEQWLETEERIREYQLALREAVNWERALQEESREVSVLVRSEGPTTTGSLVQRGVEVSAKSEMARALVDKLLKPEKVRQWSKEALELKAIVEGMALEFSEAEGVSEGASENESIWFAFATGIAELGDDSPRAAALSYFESRYATQQRPAAREQMGAAL